MKYVCNCLKHQNNQTKCFHNFEWVNASWDLDNAMVKCIIAGKASLEPCVELGAAVDLPSHHHRLHHGGDSVTSQDRRRVRRAAERNNTGLKVSDEGRVG